MRSRLSLHHTASARGWLFAGLALSALAVSAATQAPEDDPAGPVGLDGQTTLAGPATRARGIALKPIAPTRPGTYSVLAPLDLARLERLKRATISHGKLEDGELPQLFDGNRYTTVSTAAPEAGTGQAGWQVVLTQPKAVHEAWVAFAGDTAYEWTLSAANTEADLKGRRGSFRVLAERQLTRGRQADQVTFAKPVPYRAYRLDCRRVTGAGGVELAEWGLWTPQILERIEVNSFAPDLVPGGTLPLRAVGWFDGGARQNLTPDVTWQIMPPTAGSVDAFSRFEAAQPGEAKIAARFQGMNSAVLPLKVVAEGKPDWTITYVERYPREAAGATGQQSGRVQWVAHLKNYGTRTADPAAIEWRADGKRLGSGKLPKLERFAQTELVFSLPEGSRPEKVEVVIDPENEVAEVSKSNNTLTFHPDARPVGFWVEESNLRYFHRHQAELGIGSNSWEDWAQRQVALLNERAIKAAGSGQKPALWRLDRIVVVADGRLPLTEGSPTRQPDRRDTSVAVQVGFPGYDPQISDLYRRTSDKTPDNPFYFQESLRLAFVEVGKQGQ